MRMSVFQQANFKKAKEFYHSGVDVVGVGYTSIIEEVQDGRCQLSRTFLCILKCALFKVLNFMFKIKSFDSDVVNP